eukprot:TRINITY_DN132_c0_g1_i1.p1 TRINITY_DN132_c0_g1~~TRINITY_DN132_c0_g1_i1.p1  ORF type:complete len:360 (+),score=136.10 TRINITY_DN132_c0_g1_i1:64-1143(+)
MPSTTHQILLLLVCLLAFFSSRASCESVTVDPWYFSERMNLYELLLNHTDIPAVYNNQSDNILWGLPLQFAWQNRSHRLFRNESSPSQGPNGDKRIRYDAWWASMNYYLSVIPFLGAAQSGILGDTNYTIVPPNSEYSELFCTTFEGCPEVLMTKWLNFFNLVIQLQASPTTSKSDLELAQRTLWVAHVESVETASPLFMSALDSMSKTETDFGSNWAIFVDFLAAATFPTNFEQIYSLEVMLPPRVLKWNDIPGLIPGFTVDQNRVLVALELLKQVQTRTNGFLLEFFKEAVKTPRGEKEAQYLIANAVQDPLILFKGAVVMIESAILAEIESAEHRHELKNLLAEIVKAAAQLNIQL